MFPSDEIAKARADILITLPDSAAIQRGTVTTDASGYSAEPFSTVATVAARLDPLNPGNTMQTQFVGEQETIRVYHMLTTPYNTDIREGDRVLLNSETYEVLRIYDLHSMRLVVRAVLAKIGE